MNALELIDRLLKAATEDEFDLVSIGADSELMSKLESLTVQVATQPSYPLNLDLGGVVAQSELNNESYYDHEDEPGEHSEPPMTREQFADGCSFGDNIVWIVAGNSNYDQPYAPRQVFNS